jgi:hypothetical protein
MKYSQATGSAYSKQMVRTDKADRRRKRLIVLSDGSKGNAVPLQVTKSYVGWRGITPLIIKTGVRWKWVVNFTPRPIYPEKKPWCLLQRRLGGPHSRPAGLREQKVLFHVHRLIRNSADLFLQSEECILRQTAHNCNLKLLVTQPSNGHETNTRNTNLCALKIKPISFSLISIKVKKQESRCTHNVTVRRVRVTIVAVGKQ